MKIKKVKIIPFEVEHALELQVRDKDKPLKKLKEFEQWAEANWSMGPCFSGVVNGRVIGCGGVRMLFAGVGEAWAIFSKDINKYPLEAYHYSKKFLRFIMKDHKLHRVQANVRKDVDNAVRFIEKLGFEREGLMKSFGMDRKDHYLYAKVR